jgi:pSer/pThr/pTyr-binding forkhead associated (FHA) protein
MMFVIKIFYNGDTKTIESEKPELIVGRSTPAKKVDIDLTPDKMVSRKHFVLKMEYNMASSKNEAWLHDQGSSRGTLLNGIPVIEATKLEPDDKIEAGETAINVRLKAISKEDMSFQEKVSARSESFGEGSTAAMQNPKATNTPGPLSDEENSIEGEEPTISSRDEVTLGVPGLLLNSGVMQTECAGFVAYSIEDLAMAVNRYARKNKMYAISSSIVQEGKGSSACFRAMVVFHAPETG